LDSNFIVTVIQTAFKIIINTHAEGMNKYTNHLDLIKFAIRMAFDYLKKWCLEKTDKGNYIVIVSGINKHAGNKEASRREEREEVRYNKPLKDAVTEIMEHFTEETKEKCTILIQYFITNNHFNDNTVSYFTPFVAQALDREIKNVIAVRREDFTDDDLTVILAPHILAAQGRLPMPFHHWIVTSDLDYYVFQTRSLRYGKYVVKPFRGCEHPTDFDAIREFSPVYPGKKPRNHEALELKRPWLFADSIDERLHGLMSIKNDFCEPTADESEKRTLIRDIKAKLDKLTIENLLPIDTHVPEHSAFGAVRRRLRKCTEKFHEANCERVTKFVDSKVTLDKARHIIAFEGHQPNMTLDELIKAPLKPISISDAEEDVKQFNVRLCHEVQQLLNLPLTTIPEDI
jgi:hypothetical protein